MTKHLFVVVAILGFMGVAAGCSAPPPPSPPAQAADSAPDLGAEVLAIREADAQWLKAAQASDAAGEAGSLATDGVAYREHVAPLVGPAAFQAFLTKMHADNPKAKSSWSTDAIQLAKSGEIAVQTGEYHVTGLGPRGESEDKGRFVTIWKKENGQWKVAYDIGSTTMPDTTKKP